MKFTLAAAAHQRLRWLPASAAARGGAAAVPAYGLLNLNAQHNVHVIHQRLQELKNSSSSPTKPPPRTPTPPPLPTSSPCSTVTNSVGSAALPPPMSCFQALEQAMAATAAMESAPCDDDAAVVGFGADKPPRGRVVWRRASLTQHYYLTAGGRFRHEAARQPSLLLAHNARRRQHATIKQCGAPCHGAGRREDEERARVAKEGRREEGVRAQAAKARGIMAKGRRQIPSSVSLYPCQRCARLLVSRAHYLAPSFLAPTLPLIPFARLRRMRWICGCGSRDRSYRARVK